MILNSLNECKRLKHYFVFDHVFLMEHLLIVSVNEADELST